jgi:hypothetical protein
MEKWNSIVRKRDGEDPRLAESFFRLVSRMRIKDKGKFMQRMGPEFEYLVAKLSETYDPEDVKDLISDDEFFTVTMELQSKFKR